MIEPGKILYTTRIMLGLTKQQAADKIGVTPKTYAKYESDGFKGYIKCLKLMGAEVEDTKHVKIHVPGFEPIVVQHINTQKKGS